MHSSRLVVFLVAICVLVVSTAEVVLVPVSRQISNAAQAIIATVKGQPGITEALIGISKRKQLLMPFDHEARQEWSYWPRSREGLPLDYMTSDQKKLVHELLLTTLSGTGYQKVVNIMQLENVLGPIENNGLPRGVGTYELVFFGEPSDSEPWGWRFEGHHVSLNVTVLDGKTTITPSFLGSNPGEVQSGPLAGFRPLHMEEDLGFQLINSLNDADRKRAILSDQAPFDIATGTFMKDQKERDSWKVNMKPDGIVIADLGATQRKLASRIVNEVITTYRPEISVEYLNGIDVNLLHFAWMGDTERGKPYYYRLQGEDFLFEFDNVQNNANHIHSVWHSRSDNFGADMLKAHYQEAH